MGSNKRPHICIFSAEQSIHTRRWVLGLRGIGHNVDLMTLRKDPVNDIGGIDLEASGKLSYLTKIPALKSLIDKLRPDIFHAHFASSYGFLASFVKHPAKIVSVWGNDIVEFPEQNLIKKAMIKRSLTTPARITATSEFLKDTCMNFGWTLPPITVIPFGVDLNIFKFRARVPSDNVRIGIAKSLSPKYGIDILIRAFAKISLNYSNLELLIAGKGPYESEYRKLAANIGLQNKIRFLGFLSQEKVVDLMGELDIFVMPSISQESFGVAALEASATGLPVVASSVGGVADVVKDGNTGFLVRRNNLEELAGALSKLIGDHELRLKMGRNGRRFVEENYKWENNLAQMSELYQRITK